MISFVYGTDVSDLKTLKQQQRFKLFQVIYFEQQQKLEKKEAKALQHQWTAIIWIIQTYGKNLKKNMIRLR